MLASHLTSSSGFITVDRRKFLAGAGALIAAGLLPRNALALAGPYSFKQGALDVTVVSDGHLVLPISILSPDAPPEELKAILTSIGVTGDKVEPQTNATLIKAGSDLILFDTGSGNEFQPTAGKLVENLKGAGVAPESITKVVFTHAHPDHIWGTAPGGKLTYPNASYYAASAEWDFWMNPETVNKFPKEMQGFVTGAQKHWTATKDKVTMVKPGDEIAAGIKVLDTTGHTPGHVSFEVPGGEGLIIIGDAIAVPAIFFAHPEWHFGFDANNDAAVATRQKLLDRASTDKVKLLGFHWPYPGVGYAEKKGSGYQYAPAT
jgi:glyoxylase-like metal-dependent hydrolase (beta-lactamase superfamily II)